MDGNVGINTVNPSGASLFVTGEGATSGQTIFGAGDGTGKVPFFLRGDGVAYFGSTGVTTSGPFQAKGVIDAEAGISTYILKDNTGGTGGANQVPVADGAGVWGWGAAPAGDITFANLTAYTGAGVVSGVSDVESCGVSIASAVTKVGVFSVSNPQDYGGGSANSPFLIGHFPAEVYPDGVFITMLKVRNTADGSQSSDVVFSEHTGGVSVAHVDTLTTSANVWVKDSSVSGAVIEGDNDLFAEAVSGISGLAGTYVFYPR